jgi:hypothetical protein
MTATQFFWNQGLIGWKRDAYRRFSPHGRSCSMKSSFFLSGIVLDFARSAHSIDACFLHPLVHFILILIEPVDAKNIPPSKRDWGRFHAMLQYHSVGNVDDVVSVPWGGEHKVQVLHPLRAKYSIAVTEAPPINSIRTGFLMPWPCNAAPSSAR